MRVKCQCGTLLKDVGDPSDVFAELLPSKDSDDYCGAIEAAIEKHDKSNAAQYVVYDSCKFFRQMCQCPSCGRLFVEAPDRQIHEFLPVDPSLAKNVLAGRAAS